MEVRIISYSVFLMLVARLTTLNVQADILLYPHPESMSLHPGYVLKQLNNFCIYYLSFY